MRLTFRTILIATGLLAARSLRAQSIRVDVEGFYGTAQSPSVDSYRSPQLDYRSQATYGGGVNLRWIPQFSTLFTVSSANPTLRVLGDSTFGDFPTIGELRTTPLAVIAQWHFLGLGNIDPYVGAGAAWILASDAKLYPYAVDAPVSSVSPEDRLTFVAETGARFKLFGPVGFLVDVRYIPVHLDADVRFENGDILQDVDIKADQFLFGFGLSFRF